VATLASEIARLDTALADGKISQTEYDQLLKAAKSRALSDYVNIETQHVPQGNGQYSALTHPSAVALPTNNGTGIIAVVVDQHVFVNEVRDDSAGSAAKIIPGDEIISFNGITDPKEIIAAINEPASSEAKVTWRRGQTAPQTARLTW
jgi:S1-C subfamily serine protease